VIVDSQVHVWVDHPAAEPWPPSKGRPPVAPSKLHRGLEADGVIAEMDRAGVHRAVIVPSASTGLGNAPAVDAVRDHPGRFAIMGLVDLDSPGDVDVDRWRETPGMLGFRLVFHPPDSPTDDNAQWLYAGAARAGLPIMIFAPRRLDEIREVARAYPGLKLILDHMNLATSLHDEEAWTELERTLPLAELPNVAAKVSALACYSSEPYPSPRLLTEIRRIVDAFGPERSFFGSDLTRLPCTYAEWIDTVRGGIAHLGPADQDLVMGEALLRWLDW
jgi:predicted TIM-barrel fold metal-dependent hydrolase